MNNSLCIVTTLKAPPDQISSFVNYHLNIGVDHLFLFFDDKDKNIKFFEKNLRVTCISCNKSHWNKLNVGPHPSIEEKQRANANYALKLAREKGFDWLSHIDIDELIYIRRDLKEFLGRIPKRIDFVRLPCLEAVPEKMHYDNFFTEVDLFRNNFAKLSKRFFRGHIAGKSIIRTTLNIREVGIHKPAYKKGELKFRVSLYKARLLHFHCLGFDTWRRILNWRVDGTTNNKEGGEKIDSMTRRFAGVLKLDDESKLMDLYKKEFFIKEWKKKLFLLIRVLVRVHLNKDLFILQPKL